MIKGIKVYTLGIGIIFASLFFIPQISFAQPYVCLPSCSAVDGRFLVIAGLDQTTLPGPQIIITIISSGGVLEFGIFDGEAGENWDTYLNQANVLDLKFELHAAPAGDSSGLMGPVLATWTGDGSGGMNLGVPMNNNDWSNFTFPHVPQAEADNGDFIYNMRITPIAPNLPGSVESVFKIRTRGNLYVPAMFPVSFMGPLGAKESIFTVFEDAAVIYPNITFVGGICGMVGGCDYNDPACCLHVTTYDGSWSFYMQVPEGETAIDVWDGDFDYGDTSGTVFDTNDPNTPGDPFIPAWAVGTDVVFEGMAGADPNDDNENAVLVIRNPSVIYTVIDSLGNQYLNNNPSGDLEWELFRIGTTTDDPAIAEYQAASIPSGFWEVRLEGLDLSNLNSLVLPYDIFGFDEEGNPVLPPVSRNVPTLSEWGLFAMAAILGIVGFMVIRRREITA